MAILRRLTRLCSADLHGMLDQLEDKELLLKQHLRDMEEELARKEARHRRMTASRDQVRQDRDGCAREIRKLEQDLAVAVEKERDDIARFLIRKIKPMQRLHDRLQGQEETLERDRTDLSSTMDEQRLRCEEIKLRAREYCRTAGKRERERERERTLWDTPVCDPGWEPSEEEVELELLRRKEQAQGGGKS